MKDNSQLKYIFVAILCLVILFGFSQLKPVYVSNDIIDVNVTTIQFSQFNAWNNTQTGVNGSSNVIDTKNNPHISIMTSTSGVTNLSVYVSQDGINFIFCEDLTNKIRADTGLHAHIFFTAGARYYRLSSSNDVTINATIAAKP